MLSSDKKEYGVFYSVEVGCQRPNQEPNLAKQVPTFALDATLHSAGNAASARVRQSDVASPRVCETGSRRDGPERVRRTFRVNPSAYVPMLDH